MALDESSLVELKKLITLGMNNYRYLSDAGEVVNTLESLLQSVREKKVELGVLEETIGKLNSSISSANDKLKEAKDDAKAVIAGANEEYDSIISKAKDEAEKIKSTAIEKADKEYTKLVKPLEDKVAKYDALIAEKENAALEAKKLIESNQGLKAELEKDQAKLDSVKSELAKILGVGGA